MCFEMSVQSIYWVHKPAYLSLKSVSRLLLWCLERAQKVTLINKYLILDGENWLGVLQSDKATLTLTHNQRGKLWNWGLYPWNYHS